MTREEELLRRYSARQSQAAFAELVRRYLDFVYSVCRRQLGDPEMAQDVAQTVFLILAAKADSLKPGTVLSAWLFRVAHHACRNARRVEARRRRYERKAAEDMEIAASDAQARIAAASWETGLDDALAKLNESDRDAVLLRYVEEMSPDEIAAALGISPAAAHKRVSRALERLRRHFGPAGAALTVAALGVLLSETLVQAAPPAQAASILGALTGSGLGAASAAGASAHAAGAKWGSQSALFKTGLAAALLALAGVAGLGWVSPRTVRALLKRPAPRAAAAPVPTLTLRGRILGVGGRPAPGVAVTLLRYGISGGLAAEFARIRTDEAGRYAVAGAPAGPDGWAVVADSGRSLGFGAPGGDCPLLPPTSVRLRLIGADGRPVPNVRVQPLILSVLRPDGRVAEFNLSVGCPDRLQVTSNAAGVAAFAGLPQGAVASFAVLDARYVRRPPSADGLLLARAAQSGEVAVALSPGAEVAGQVTYGPTDRPAAGVRVGAQQIGTAAWGEAVTDAGGRYRIGQLGPGRYNVALDEQSPPLGGEWTADAAAGVVLSPARPNTRANLRLVRGALITGRVTFQGSGRPAGGVEIGAYGPAHPATGAWVGGGWTDGGGAYQIRVPPGRQRVYPMPGASPGQGADVSVGDGRNAVVDFALPPPG